MAVRDRQKRKGKDALIGEVTDRLDECRSRFHNQFVDGVEHRYEAWRGEPRERSEAKQWQSQLFPAYIFPIVQTIVASTVDDKLRFRVRPKPRMASAEEQATYAKGAKALELLLAYQMDLDDFTQKQVEFVQQVAIAGLSVLKPYWRYETEKYTERIQQQEFDPFLGVQTGSFVEDREATRVTYDDPCLEVVDVRDFFWHESAKDVQSSQFLIHRVYRPWEELKRLEMIKLPDGTGLFQNVDQLKDDTRTGDSSYDREQRHGDRERTRDMVEVLEYWCRKPDGVYTATVGNRAVLLQPLRKSPFDHGEYPFIACSTQPDLFQIAGVAEVGLLEPVQRLMWDLGNQTLDNIRLSANSIFTGPAEELDSDKRDFAPGEYWESDNPEMIKQFQFDPTPIQIGLGYLANLKGELQNLSSGMPFLSGAESQSVDQETATGVSIITSLAQRVVAFKKQLISWAYEEAACQMVSLNQQFLDGPKLVPKIGADGAQAFEQVYPDDIQGEYYVTLSAMSESLMRQERRAEAQAKLQMFLEAAPVFAAVGIPLNGRAFLDDYLEAFEVDDPERYYSALPQAAAAAGGQPGQNGAPSPGGSEQGVTSSLAYDAGSPSSQTSLSPEVFMQRMGAQRGGANNT